MNILITVLLFLFGLAIVIKGSDLFLDCVIFFARAFRVSDIIIGFTLVSIGTTMPETVVSSASSLSGLPDMALSNAFGSVACNLGLILALGIIISSPKLEQQSYLIKNTGLLVSACLFYWILLAFKAPISRLVGVFMLILLVLYLFWNIRSAGTADSCEDVPAITKNKLIKNIFGFLIGLGLIIWGASMIVTYGEKLAVLLGVSPTIIGLTMAALGTSMPEFFTMLTAIYKKAGGVAIGNLIGASIFNLLLVIPVSAIISPFNMNDFPVWRTFHLPCTLLICSIILVFVSLKRERIPRFGGVLMMGVYFAYIITSVVYFG